MPERKPRFIPRRRRPEDGIRVPSAGYNDVPYYGTGISSDARFTCVGPVNSDLYSPSLRSFCQHNDAEVTQSALRVRADRVTSRLEQIRRIELENKADTQSEPDLTPPRWQCRETRLKYTGSLEGAKRDYFELEDIDYRTDIMKPQANNITVTAAPLNGYCYLCTTQEEHRQHLRSEKKVKGKQLRHYDNPIKPDSLPSRPFSASSTERSHNNTEKAIYKVVVKTGNQLNCGTDAEVTLRMYGLSLKQKTPKIVLKKPSARFMFLRYSTNTFSVTAANFEQVTSIDIETDGYEKTQSWFLEWIQITNMKTKVSYYFPCSDWLSLYHKGETLVRRLTPVEKEELHRDYEVTVVTGGHKHSGTDSKAYLTLVGAQGKRSTKQNLSHKDGSHSFRRGAVDTFKLQLKDIGTLSKIRIEHNDKGKSRRWHLLLVFIKDLYSKRQHIFFCNQWLVNEENNAVWREIPASKVPKEFNIGSWSGKNEGGSEEVLYEVNVFTGDVGFAGTDARVYIQLYGDRSTSKIITLSEMRGNYEDPFEKNQTDIFQLKAVDVGDIKKIKVGHDSQGLAAGWFLEKVLIRKFIDVRTRVPIEEKKRVEESEDDSSSESSDSDTETEAEPFVIGRNLTRSSSVVSKKEKKKQKKEKKKQKEREENDKKKKRSSTTSSVIHSVTSSKLAVRDAAISDSDKDIDEEEDLSDDSEEETNTKSRGRSSGSRSSASSLNDRKKSKNEKRQRRMDNLSDVDEISEDSAATSLWDSDEMPAVDNQIQEALRLKQEHDKLTKTMEKVIPKVEEYLFQCKEWFADNEGDGKTERMLKVAEKNVYNRSDSEDST